MSNEFKSMLTQAQQDKNMVVVYRDELGGAFYAGVPVLQTDTLLVLAKEQEFNLDGFVVLRQKDITLVEQYDDNDFCRRVLEGEGVYQRVQAPKVPGCQSWQQLMEGILKNYGGWLTVECESPTETLFFVGIGISSDKNYLMMRRVDADGSWHKDATTVPLQDITAVTFGGHYLSVYQKYCKKPK